MAKETHAPTLRIECEPIEVTLGPDAGLLGLEPDVYRKFVPGRPRYFIDDLEISRSTYETLDLAHQLGAEYSPTQWRVLARLLDDPEEPSGRAPEPPDNSTTP